MLSINFSKAHPNWNWFCVYVFFLPIIKSMNWFAFNFILLMVKQLLFMAFVFFIYIPSLSINSSVTTAFILAKNLYIFNIEYLPDPIFFIANLLSIKNAHLFLIFPPFCLHLIKCTNRMFINQFLMCHPNWVSKVSIFVFIFIRMQHFPFQNLIGPWTKTL